MSLKMYSFFIEEKDLHQVRKIAKKEKLSFGWVLRKMINNGIANWRSIMDSNGQ